MFCTVLERERRHIAGTMSAGLFGKPQIVFNILAGEAGDRVLSGKTNMR